MIAPDLLPRREFNDPDAALAHVRAIYDSGVAHLRKHLQAFLDGASAVVSAKCRELIT